MVFGEPDVNQTDYVDSRKAADLVALPACHKLFRPSYLWQAHCNKECEQLDPGSPGESPSRHRSGSAKAAAAALGVSAAAKRSRPPLYERPAISTN
jgi:hypothetical protein